MPTTAIAYRHAQYPIIGLMHYNQLLTYTSRVMHSDHLAIQSFPLIHNSTQWSLRIEALHVDVLFGGGFILTIRLQCGLIVQAKLLTYFPLEDLIGKGDQISKSLRPVLCH